MKVLIACEFSGIVREEFRKLGHEAWSCDLLPTEIPGNHYQGDIFEFLKLERYWDLMIAHPPCTRLTVAANKYYKPEYANRFPNIQIERKKAVKFFMDIVHIPIKKKCIENPIGIMSSLYKKPSQIIQPYQFGETERKATCLWLENLPKLTSTDIVKPEIIYHASGKTDSMLHYRSLRLPPKDRQKLRSKTFLGIAKAMAEQWSNYD